MCGLRRMPIQRANTMAIYKHDKECTPTGAPTSILVGIFMVSAGGA